MTRVALYMMAVLAVALANGNALAEDHGRVRALVEAGEILPLEELVAKAREAHPGRLLEAELEDADGRYVYEIELIDAEHRVWELYYDARSGELLKQEEDERD